MFIVGLTGGIGSGKTAASDYFQQLGIEIVDADVVAREVVEPGQPALASIAENFGKDILLDDGTLNRQALRERVFSNPEEKVWLESLLHPLIGAEIDRQLAATASPYAMFVSPLLLDTQQHQRCHRIVVVDVPVETQVARASARDNNNEALIRAIISNQISREDRLAKADDVLRNDSDLANLHAQIDQLHRKYLELAG